MKLFITAGKIIGGTIMGIGLAVVMDAIEQIYLRN